MSNNEDEVKEAKDLAVNSEGEPEGATADETVKPASEAPERPPDADVEPVTSEPPDLAEPHEADARAPELGTEAVQAAPEVPKLADDAPSEVPETPLDPLAAQLGEAGEVLAPGREALEWPEEPPETSTEPPKLAPEAEKPTLDVPELESEDEEPPPEPIGIEPVADDLLTPVATQQPVEPLGPQPGMSRKERYAATGERPSLAAPGYESGEYAQPEPADDFDIEPGAPEEGIVASDPWGLKDKPPPERPATEVPPAPAEAAPATPPGMGSTDALITAVQKGNELTEKLLASVDMLNGEITEMTGKLDAIQEAIENISVGLP